jgi:hypothetical protein
MKKTWRDLTIPKGMMVLLTLALFFFLTACSPSLSYSEIVDGPDGEQLALHPSEAQLVCSERLDLEVSGGVPPYDLKLIAPLGGRNEILENGYYQAPEDNTGKAVVQVTDSYGVSSEAEITVVSQAGSLPLILSPSSISLYKGKNVTLEASGGAGGYSFALLQAIGGTGESLTGSSYTAPTDTGGTAVVRVTDGSGDTADSTIQVSFTTPSVPDVNYGSVTISNAGSTQGGGAFSGTFSFSNNGNDNGSRAINWIVYYSTDTSIGSGDTIVSQGELAALNTGAGSGNIPFSGTWPYLPYNTTYYLIASISAEDDVEAGNDTGSKSVELEAVIEKDIDYEISGFSVNTVPASVNDNYFVGFNFYNSGSENGAETINWGVYRSADDDWDEGDTLITSGTHAAMNSGAYDWINISDPWPSPAGTWYLIVKILADDEINQTNNYAGHGPFTVN